MKDNVDYHVTKVLIENTKQKNAIRLLKEHYITIGVKETGFKAGNTSLRS
jgi:hypothetical protein